MSANADYGVSIVESFAPPANWLPGQEVNKDVYAVNTGNIAAFVKEKLSGVLDYSYETLVSKFDAKDCVELVPMADTEIDGATTNEAGSFLAWTDTEEPTGFKKSLRNEDDPDGEAWHPTKTGHYIFRRSVKTEDGVTKFTYAGYYFVEGAEEDDPETSDIDERVDRYYKIVIGKDAFRAATDGSGTVVKDKDGSVRYEFDLLCKQVDLYTAATTVDETTGEVTVTETAITPAADGTFTEKPIISYVKVVDLDPQDVSFTYTDGTADKYDGAPYLAVRFSNAQGDLEARTADLADAEAALAAAEDALVAAKEAAAATSHDLAEKEVEYRNAEYAYYTAKARYDKTLADMTYANALVTATNNLYEPALNRANAEEQMKALKDAMEKAAKAVRDEANKEQGEAVGDVTDTQFTEPNFNAVVAAMLSTDAPDPDDPSDTTVVTGIASSVLVPLDIRDLINNNVNGTTVPGGSDLTEAKRNLEVLDSIWAQIAGEDGTGTTAGILKKITDDYNNFENTVAVGNQETDTKPDTLDKSTDPKGYLQNLSADLERLEELLDAYASAYTRFTTTEGLEAALTDLNNANEIGTGNDGVVARIEGYSSGKASTDSGKVNSLNTKANDATDGTGGLKEKIDKYRTAYQAYYNYMNPTSGGYYTAVNAWNNAVTTYNNEVYNNDNSAKKVYDNTITTTKEDTKNLALEGVTVDPVGTDGKKQLHSDGTALVAGFSAHSIGHNTDAMAEETGSNLTARPAGAGGAVSNTDGNTDPRITGDDTNYLKYVLLNKEGTEAGQYNSANPFDATNNPRYLTMTPVDTKANTAFYQLGADPEGGDKQLLSDLTTALGTTSTADTATYKWNQAKQTYDNAVAAANAENGAIANLTAAEKAVADAEKALNDARVAKAVQSDVGSNIKIDVVLDKNVIKNTAQQTDNATWIFDTATDNSETPTFYYNRILDPGKTSEKLVDKLVFCDDVTAKDFTELTFDLNVALDSMQVTYDPQDNVTMTPTAVNASKDFDMKAEITNQGTKAVEWNPADAVATVYKVGDDEVTVTDLETDEKVKVGNTEYGYKVTVNGTDYYGVKKPKAGENATFYKINTTGASPVLVTGEGSTVVVTAK